MDATRRRLGRLLADALADCHGTVTAMRLLVGLLLDAGAQSELESLIEENDVALYAMYLVERDELMEPGGREAAYD